jgi:oligoendopeptidase F
MEIDITNHRERGRSIMHEESLTPTRWSLTDLLPATEGPELDRILADLEMAVAGLEASRDQLSPDLPEAEFGRLMALIEQIAALSTRLGAYGFLWYTEDTQHQEALAFRGRIDKLITDIQNRTLFFTLWWKDLDDEPARRLLAASGDNAYYLESLRRFKPHTLSEPEEKVINLKNVNGVEALVTVYGMITNAFTFKVEIDGELKELNRSELSVYARDPRPEVRAAIYQELYRVYGQEGTILGQIYQHIVRDWASEKLTLRNFPSPIAVRNLGNDIPDPVVDALLQVCRENAGLFQRYFRLKAGWLGLDKLRRYDIYAPLSTSDRTYPFAEAAGMVLDSLHRFSPTLADRARRVFADGHLDSEVRLRKDSGAFCLATLPRLTPWVLVNYNGKVDDVATLAHELGHAIHALMASDHSPLTFHASLPLAETASGFSEMLLLERLLSHESDPAVRRDMLAHFVDDSYATVMRQAYFVLFEREAHALIEEGRTTDFLAERYLVNLQEQFADAVALSDEFRWEWVSIPHIYERPFYCYAYAFGQLLVLALYRQFKAEGNAFIPRYLKILAYGGSRSPAEILGEAGIDIASPSFWQGGFDVIAEMIQELEALA